MCTLPTRTNKDIALRIDTLWNIPVGFFHIQSQSTYRIELSIQVDSIPLSLPFFSGNIVQLLPTRRRCNLINASIEDNNKH
jgi:hypothetical protein